MHERIYPYARIGFWNYRKPSIGNGRMIYARKLYRRTVKEGS
nr:MAG TPA: hypothetical protein [Caudoviricetes sp.]